MSRKLCLPLFLLLSSSLPCLARQTAQQTAEQTASVGYAACPAGEGYVYLYRSPNDFTVLANLKCGARIEILGSGNGYVVARTPEGKQGYILLSAVTSAAPATPAMASAFVSNPQPPARAATSSPIFGNAGRAEISAGYSYVSMDLSGLGALPRGNGNGFQSSLTVNLNRWLAAEGTVDGYFKNNPLSVANFYDYTLMAGPRVTLIRPFFVHALFGVDLLTASVSGSPTFSQSSVAGALGGGAQWRIRPLWSVYATLDYVVALHSLPGNPVATQNNVRVSGGIVFHIGGGFAGIRN